MVATKTRGCSREGDSIACHYEKHRIYLVYASVGTGAAPIRLLLCKSHVDDMRRKAAERHIPVQEHGYGLRSCRLIDLIGILGLVLLAVLIVLAAAKAAEILIRMWSLAPPTGGIS